MDEVTMKIMKPDDVSQWFRIPKSTLYKLCLAGRIPGKKIGKHWRFDREELERWFREKEYC